MTTWLDRFLLDAGREVAADLVDRGEGHLPQAKNPLLAMMMTANRAAVIRARSRGGVDINTEFDATVARWFLDQGGHSDRHVAAFQVDQKTLGGLAKLQMTKAMADEAEMFNNQYLAVYLDFVDQALVIADSFEVSAIVLLTQRSSDGRRPAAPRAFAVVSPPGEFSRRILTWMWGATHEVMAIDTVPPLSGPPNQQPVSADLLQAAGVTSSMLAQELQRVACVTAWYAAQEQERGLASHLRKIDVRRAEKLNGPDAFLPAGSTFLNVSRLLPAGHGDASKSGEALKGTRYPAILIDPYQRSVKSVNVTSSVETLQQAIGGDIQLAAEFDKGDILYVDDEGLFTHRLSFEIDGQMFPGRGLIVGSYGGEYALAAVKCSVDDIIRRVKFFEPDPTLGTNRVVVVPA
ncbi:DUF3846 domain-containing protein [Tardiphaga sp.]|uniref:DUF3846 domain-containing protein n=1 Tax=Tardiphaga sp. TaxID=1926292 RepID=UPI00352BC260